MLRGSTRLSTLRALALVLALAACQAPPRPSFVEQIHELAGYPELQDVALTLANEVQDPALVPIAERLLVDASVARRRACYRLLALAPWQGQRRAVMRGLHDASHIVQAACVATLAQSGLWDNDIRDRLWDMVATSPDGHVVRLAGAQLVEKEGEPAAIRVFDTLRARGPDWPECALVSFAKHPLPAFSGVFAAAYRSAEFDSSVVGCRGLLALGETARVADAELAKSRTFEEWCSDWASGQHRPAVAIPREAWLARAREARVVIVGEEHGMPTECAAELDLASELFAVHGSNLVLVYELPVQLRQQPVISTMTQLGVEVRNLESGIEPSSPARDVVARQNLQSMVRAEPEKRFLVIYGDLHLRSLHAAMRDIDVDAVAVTHRHSNTMLTDAIRMVGWRIQEHVFCFGDETYYAPRGSYGVILGSPKLDEVIRRAGW